MKRDSAEEKSALDTLYSEKRKRSLEIVRLSIETLQQRNIKVTLQAIVNIAMELSIEFNDNNLKISHMTILRNEECRKLYENFREHQNKRRKNNLKKIDPPLTKYEVNKIRELSRLTKNDLLLLLIESERKNKNELSINTKLREKLITIQMKI
ncbi:hypothetical protein [Acinetobacter sp. 1125_18A]|uniref:hypothetical protein n=1 Tax=Acinetobacter sp. 1125_18A TaxID=2605959 RepID=UPI00405866A4